MRPSLRLNPANQTLAEYIVTPRDPGYDLDPIVDLGGPVLRDRAWFYVGYGPQVSRRERTVTFTSNQQLSTFNNDSEDHNLTYNVTSQLSANTRLRFAGGNIRGYGGVGTANLPTIEPNGTSNSNAALFPNPLHTDTTNNTSIGRAVVGGVAHVLREHSDRNLQHQLVPGHRHGVLDGAAPDVRSIKYLHGCGRLSGVSVPGNPSLVTAAPEL